MPANQWSMSAHARMVRQGCACNGTIEPDGRPVGRPVAFLAMGSGLARRSDRRPLRRDAALLFFQKRGVDRCLKGTKDVADQKYRPFIRMVTKGDAQTFVADVASDCLRAVQ